MQFNTISIGEFRKENLRNANYYLDDLIITDNIKHVEQFRHPCRINAITFLICASGELNCSINLRDYQISSNGILVNFPENIIQIADANDFKGHILLISQPYLEKLHIDVRKKLISYINLKENPQTKVAPEDITFFQHFYYQMKESIDNNCPERDSIIEGLIISFIFKVISLINIYQKDSDLSESEKSINQRYFEKFMTLLSQFHFKERSVGFYASQMHLTANYLSGLIKQYSGKTATEWITEYVILEAKALLKFSGLNIQQVAYNLNFPSQSVFGKYFKKETGISPKIYIKS